MEKNLIKRRIIMSLFIILILFTFSSYKLYLIQVEDRELLTREVREQRGREFLTYPKRGIIFDRNFKPLTNSEVETSIIVKRDLIINDITLYKKILKEGKIGKRELNQLLKSKEDLLQILIKDKLNFENHPRLFLVDSTRRYREDNLLSHVIGYINQADSFGQTGIEHVHDEFLSNRDRESFIVEYDRDRNIVLGGSQYVNKTSNNLDPTAVQLTIDLDIQIAIERIMDEGSYNGAIIVSDIESGEIVSMVSRPNFDQDNINKYLNNQDLALYNKAVQVAYPPGSIFKLVVLLAALEEDINVKNEEFYCPGYELVSGRPQIVLGPMGV